MSRQEITNFYRHIQTLLEAKFEIVSALDELRNDVLRLENTSDSEINWSYILQDLTTELNNLNVEYELGFIDDIEEAINDLEFKEKRAIQKMRESVNPLFKYTPVYFDAANPPTIGDYAKDKKDTK